jgi:hypothetical protein
VLKHDTAQILLTECEQEMTPQAKQVHTAAASYASHWGKTKK